MRCGMCVHLHSIPFVGLEIAWSQMKHWHNSGLPILSQTYWPHVAILYPIYTRSFQLHPLYIYRTHILEWKQWTSDIPSLYFTLAIFGLSLTSSESRPWHSFACYQPINIPEVTPLEHRTVWRKIALKKMIYLAFQLLLIMKDLSVVFK